MAATRIQAAYRGRYVAQIGVNGGVFLIDIVRRDRKKVTKLRSLLDDEDMELMEMDEPPSIDKCKGKWLIRKGEEDEGIVKGVDPATCMMKVLYEIEGVDELKAVDVPYDEAGLIWLEAVSKPSATDQTEAGVIDEQEVEAAATRIQALFRGR